MSNLNSQLEKIENVMRQNTVEKLIQYEVVNSSDFETLYDSHFGDKQEVIDRFREKVPGVCKMEIQSPRCICVIAKYQTDVKDPILKEGVFTRIVQSDALIQEAIRKGATLRFITFLTTKNKYRHDQVYTKEILIYDSGYFIQKQNKVLTRPYFRMNFNKDIQFGILHGQLKQFQSIGLVSSFSCNPKLLELSTQFQLEQHMMIRNKKISVFVLNDIDEFKYM